MKSSKYINPFLLVPDHQGALLEILNSIFLHYVGLLKFAEGDLQNAVVFVQIAHFELFWL